FPYAIRVSSEVMESNGSTSMASVCSGVLALMDAGVPITRPVAGISCGLVTEYAAGHMSRYTMLTDIIGSEDHFGDMDFKLCGTSVGVTGFQLDLKLPGISLKLMEEAVYRTRDARMKVLDVMTAALAAPRTELSQYAPRIETIKIPVDKIGLLIGPGGKTIKGIVAETGCEINIEDDGSVRIYSNNPDGMARAKEIVNGMTKEIEIGTVYQGRVVTIKEFGCFVEVMPGKDGMVHISEFADFRVNRMEDVTKVGDLIWVKCIGVDEKGRVKLSRRAAMKDRNEEAGATPGALEAIAAGGGQSEQSPDRDRGRGDRGGGRDRERSREHR
ncbi:MAG: KH domain-containing protein, partial [Chthoniobacteraceae bacterium]